MNKTETIANLTDLYETDETAWLEQMAALASNGDAAAMDLTHLSEYLHDMVRREKREVSHRLATLLVHLLKWEHQPEKRSRSWELTIREQREELSELMESGSLRNHAEQQLAATYQKAARRAGVETDLPEGAFPQECPYTLDQAQGEQAGVFLLAFLANAYNRLQMGALS